MLDQNIDTVISVIDELIIDRGIFHSEIYFSSNRATLWNQAGPYRYRILFVDELVDLDVCLSFPKTVYPETSTVAASSIRRVLETFRDLRFTDENVYLRLCTLYIFNEMVGLTFSCDGSHSIAVDEFLEKGFDFWIGRAAAGVTTLPGATHGS